jgi:hypothetical protein
MKQNKDDIEFVACARNLECTAEMIRRLTKQRFVLYIVAALQLGLLGFDIIGHLVTNTTRPSGIPVTMIAFMMAISLALALHSDAKLKVLLVLTEFRNNK